ncbi:MAG: 5-deoxy-glucuronate isomerase [Betaproteobacteria bacterium]|nr:5-deoxy-glucuronate isomerase [Betaproteobacteria bacterium]
MSALLVRPHAPDLHGGVLEVTPQSAGWSHVGFKVHHLEAGQSLAGGENDRETCLVVIAGKVKLHVDGDELGTIGGRASVFEDAAPGAAYIPAGSSFRFLAISKAEVAICSAPGKPGREARVIADSAMSRETRGQGTNTRYVRNILPQTEPADSLLVVEVITPGGNWSSYPPHKHDTAKVDEETALEETYYHRLNPPQGFAFQRVYTDDLSLDEAICVQDGDVVMVPRGYHPVGAPHGYDLYYLNVMAGPTRQWIFRNDPAHEWMLKKK